MHHFTCARFTQPTHTGRHQSKKMTEEEFINNNRGIDNGESLPAQLLSELYQGIVNNEILTTKEVLQNYTILYSKFTLK